jgi:hypothetical protein
MITPGEMYSILRQMSYNVKPYSGGDKWAAGVSEQWAKHFRRVSVATVQDAANRWVRAETSRPTLVQFDAMVDQCKTQPERTSPDKGCADCGHSGWRWCTIHTMNTRSGRREVTEITIACNCRRGRKYAHAQDGRSVEEVVESYQRDSGYIEHHLTDRNHQSYPLSMRLAPQQYQDLQSHPPGRGLKRFK